MTNKTQSGFYFTELLKDPSQLEKPDPAIGLVSMDDLISNVIGIHPMRFRKQPSFQSSNSRWYWSAPVNSVLRQNGM